MYMFLQGAFVLLWSYKLQKVFFSFFSGQTLLTSAVVRQCSEVVGIHVTDRMSVNSPHHLRHTNNTQTDDVIQRVRTQLYPITYCSLSSAVLFKCLFKASDCYCYSTMIQVDSFTDEVQRLRNSCL